MGKGYQCIGMKSLLDGKTEWRYNPKWSLGDDEEAIWGDERLSFKAKGVWGYMRSKPPMWDFSAARMASESRDERKSVLGAMKELEGLGYLSRIKLGNGRVVYVLSGNSYVGVEPEVGKSPLYGAEVSMEEPTGRRKQTVSNVVDFVCLAYVAYGVNRGQVKELLDRGEIRTYEQARNWMERTGGVELIGMPDSVPF